MNVNVSSERTMSMPQRKRRDTQEERRRMTLSDWPEEDVGDARSLSLSQVVWPPQVTSNGTHISSASSSSSTGGGVNLEGVNFPASTQGGRRPSIQQKFQAKRKPSISTVVTSNVSSITDNSTSVLGGGNIWTRILSGQKETLWDKLGDGDAEADEDDDGNSLGWGSDPLDGSGGCAPALKLCTLTAIYESRHFINTIKAHPRILLISLAVTALVCGLGIVAIESESRAYVNKQRNLAELKARETGQWFADEFRRAMLPLYSIQQGIIHSGYFDDLADQIGPYPNLLLPQDSSQIGPYPNLLLPQDSSEDVRRNVTGICDSRDMINKWRDIVIPVNSENDLDGVVVGYRLFPNNVACLTEPYAQESSPHFNAFDMPQGDDPLSSDVASGYDHGQADNMMSKMITKELFFDNKLNVFGPFTKAPMTELICGHLAVWRNKPDVQGVSEQQEERSLQELTGSRPTEQIVYTLNIDEALEAATTSYDRTCPSTDSLNIHGTCVEGAWGFVGNFLDWTRLKDKSDIYQRFADAKLDFQLSRVSGPTMPGMDLAILAESPNASLLDDTNSIVVFTDSLHGTWQNRVGDTIGWEPSWYIPALFCTILGSLLLGLLTASMLVERQHHRNLLYKVMPKNAIAKLSRGQTVVDKFNIVTVFFCDIVGYTSMAGGMSPIQVMKMLNELYIEFDKIVAKHQVYKVETIGDAYMVVGGAPDRVPALLAAQRVALFALDIVEFVKTFRTRNGDQLYIRAGIASGPAVAGVIGDAMPRYCFFGDTVNFASRMESTSKKMRIQCADITCRLLQDAPSMSFNLKKRTEGDIVGVDVKGKGHLITYWIEGASTRLMNEPLPSLLPHDVEENGRAYSHQNGYANGAIEVVDMETPQEMFTPYEVYMALTSQEWCKIGHAESMLVCATADRKKMNFRATGMLEYHLDRVIKHRDPDEDVSLSTRIQLSKFVEAVSQTYSDVMFHNYQHAIHVMTSMNTLLTFVLTEDPLNSFSLVFSALIHDAGHTGMSNKILVESRHPLSEKWCAKDVPIAERNSIDLVLSILFRPEYQSLRDAIIPGEKDKIQFGKTLFQSILITDIATPDNVKGSITRHDACQGLVPLTAALCPIKDCLDDVLDGLGLDGSVKERNPDDFVVTPSGLRSCARNEHLMLLSDIAHLLQGWANFVKWNFRLYKELNVNFKKGLCPDPRVGWYEGQIGFLDMYILPLAKRTANYLRPDFAEELINNGMENRRLWTEHGKLASEIISKAVADDAKEIDVLHRLYELPTLE